MTLAIFESPSRLLPRSTGAAVGIGATMSLGMDIRLASEKARIGCVFGKIGIAPEACSTGFLPRIVGISQALEWIYAADILDAQETLRGRLVKGVVPSEQLLEEARRLARRFVDNRSPVGAFPEKREPQFTARTSADLPPFYTEWVRRPEWGAYKTGGQKQAGARPAWMWQLRTSAVATSALS